MDPTITYSLSSTIGLIAVGVGLTIRNFMRPRFQRQKSRIDRARGVPEDRC